MLYRYRQKQILEAAEPEDENEEALKKEFASFKKMKSMEEAAIKKQIEYESSQSTNKKAFESVFTFNNQKNQEQGNMFEDIESKKATPINVMEIEVSKQQ